MAQLFNLTVFAVCISLLQFTVLSQPIAAGVTTSPGSGLGAGVQAAADGGAATGAGAEGALGGGSGAVGEMEGAIGGAAGTAGDMEGALGGVAGTAGDMQGALGGAAGTFGSAVGGLPTSGLGMVTEMPQALMQLAANTGVGTAQLAAQIAAAKLENGMSVAQALAGLGGNKAGSALNFASGLGGISGSNGFPNMAALQRYGSTFAFPAMAANAMRDGTLSLIDIADQGTGQLNGGIRQFGLGTAGLIDGGLSTMGIQQPMAGPMFDGGWQMGEGGRQRFFEAGRQGVNGGFQFPGLLSQGSFGGSGASSGLSLDSAMPTTSFQAEAGAA